MLSKSENIGIPWILLELIISVFLNDNYALGYEINVLFVRTQSLEIFIAGKKLAYSVQVFNAHDWDCSVVSGGTGKPKCESVTSTKFCHDQLFRMYYIETKHLFCPEQVIFIWWMIPLFIRIEMGYHTCLRCPMLRFILQVAWFVVGWVVLCPIHHRYT